MESNERKQVELRSEEVQEILSRPPHWLVRWGISVIGSIIVLFFVGSFFFYYPEVVESEITITTENPPAWIVARSAGELKDIFVPDKQVVREGEVIAILENPASTDDMNKLFNLLPADGILTDSVITSIQLPAELRLGMVQAPYSVLQKALNNYLTFVSLALYQQKKDAVRNQLKGYETYLTHMNNQVSLSKRGVDIAEKDYQREKQLYHKQLSSEVALEESDKILLSAKQGTEQLMTSVSSSHIELARLNSTLTELEIQQNQELSQLVTNVQSAWNDLWVALRGWELAYVLKSPKSGVVSYNEVWKENQQINAGDKVFSVVSTTPGKILGRVKIPHSGAGKVKKGQRVNIKVDGFPYMEYGFLTGRVESVSLLAHNKVYSAVVSMPRRLNTSYHKQLPFKGELSGTAEIITEDLSVGWRILNPVRYLFKKSFTNGSEYESR